MAPYIFIRKNHIPRREKRHFFKESHFPLWCEIQIGHCPFEWHRCEWNYVITFAVSSQVNCILVTYLSYYSKVFFEQVTFPDAVVYYCPFYAKNVLALCILKWQNVRSDEFFSKVKCNASILKYTENAFGPYLSINHYWTARIGLKVSFVGRGGKRNK